MATDATEEDFVTIVPVGEGRPSAQDPSFVTVLTVGAATGASEVTVRRPRGERLGLGLKFEGGSAAAEKVRRLLVQSCAENSPAANATAPWGKLKPGDEILAIDGESVSNLTRIDCVRRLKDSDEILTLLVRHFEQDIKTARGNMEEIDSVANIKSPSSIIRPTTLPPPVPPRKLGKKNSFKDKATLQTVGEQNNSNNNDSQIENMMNGKHNGISTLNKLSRKSSFDSHIHRQTKEGMTHLKKGSPEEVRRLVRRLSDGKAMPPEAEVYIDLLSTEWERCLVLADAESDDTGSSISTVVDRLGSMANSVENSIPSTPTMQPKTIDIQKVLNCIENIDTNILKDMTSKRFLEKHVEINNEAKLTEKFNVNTCFNNQENVMQNTSINEEVINSSKKVTHSDKNNNNTIATNGSNNGDVILTNQLKKIDSKIENFIDKPKPMPRNTKIERSASEKKPKTIPVPGISPPPATNPLLTPTKKNCIETWLKRSEAEMNNKIVEKLEDSSIPEILPRLIDFVPKHQFKENSTEPPLTRPTTAPPPPPTETREDGSGASLDTIGELDESADVTDNAKPVEVTENKERKSSFERTFWEDRINKSDVEDKSLSNDETPLPSCPRQPPDGVETPCDAVEKTPESVSRLPPRLPAGWPGTRPRYSYTSRTQDARSEASVKDKIAMFSTDVAVSSDRLDKCGTLPNRNSSIARKSTTNYSGSYSDVSSLDRRLTKSQDNLDDIPRSYKRHTERPEVLGGVEKVSTTSSYSSAKSSNTSLYTENKPLFYGSTTTLSSSTDPTFAKSVYHARSSSDDNGNKNISRHKSNLEYLIEQRKKSMSKLRGLVIPEVHTPIIDLPEIKVQDPLPNSFLLKSNQNNINSKLNKPSNTKPLNLTETKWKADLLPNNLPKYSPAFKRKSLQVYTPSCLSKESTPESNYNERIDLMNKMTYKNNHSSAPRASLSNGIISGLSTKTTGTIKPVTAETINSTRKDHKDILNCIRDYKKNDIKLCTSTEVVDSDNDSAMSSTQSSYRSSASSPMHNIENVESDSSRLSPRGSHYATYSIFKTENKSNTVEKISEQYIKRNVCRSMSSDTNVSLSSSAGSAATSGSQASCSSLESSVADSEKRKVSKTYNIDTINRRNILASAKCRSGRDAKLKSPVIETKFSQESCDRSPSPVHKTSERLSTLTPSVSVVSNKGENRRRNKIIADTDSDSDSDVNVWPRKNDYKNSRLKRNSSSATKKQNDITLESPKSEDAPKIISEKILKEIKKAGLDNYTNSKTPRLSAEKSEIITKKTEHTLKDSLEKTKKSEVIECQKAADIISGRDTNKQNKETVLESIKKSEFDKLTDNPNNSFVEERSILTQTIRLLRGAGTGVGVILAGGIDCEAKDVTVHRVLADSVAAKAGLKRGVKVRSINGCAMAGLTHAQSVTILKEHRSEVIIKVEIENCQDTNSCGSEKAESKVRNETTGDLKDNSKAASSVVSVVLEKAGGGAGLGFGLDGGRDSPRGDRPLTIKKLFAGGAAAQSGRVLVGAELLSAGGQSMEGYTRTQAWAALKALPAGPVTLVLKNPTGNRDM